MTLILSVVLTFICTIGIAFNVYTVLIIILTKQGNTANNVLLLHLGLINILIGILFLIFCLPGVKETEWARNGAPCTVNGFLFTLLHPLAVWTICGLNCDRYYAIAAPLHYSHIVSIKKVLIGLFVGWANSVILAIPPLFNAAPYRYLPGLGACAPEFRNGSISIWYAAGYTTFTLLLPTTVFICCNAKILLIARYHRHRIASAIFEVALSAQVTITHQRNPFFVPTVTAPAAGGPKFRGSNPILVVFLLIASFLLICVPYYVLILYEAASHSLLKISNNNNNNDDIIESTSSSASDTNQLYVAAGTLLICSPAVNGYLYGLKNKNLRKAFMNYWRKKQTKNELQHEIQARTPSTCGSRKPSLTPFGVFSKNPSVSRRMSETLIDVNRSLRNPQKNKIQRITSDLMWMRHSSATSLNLSAKDELSPKSIKQTISCNTLRVPEETDIVIEENNVHHQHKNSDNKETIIYAAIHNKSSIIPGSLILQKIFKLDENNKSLKKSLKKELNFNSKRSPRILITRAYSEESEKNSQNNSPIKEISKKHSNSASNLIEKKWRQIKYHQDEETDSSDGTKSSCIFTKPLLASETISNRSSESSETSGSSSGKFFINIEERRMSMETSEAESNEDQLLLTWNSHKKYHHPEDARRRTSKSSILNVTVQEIIL